MLCSATRAVHAVITAANRQCCNRRGRTLLLALLCLASGCATRWALKTAQPPTALQWPFQPNQAKATYVQSLTGLAPDKGTAWVLKAIVFGTETEDRNAFVLPVAVATGDDGRIAVADMGRRCVHLYVPREQRYQQLKGSDRDKIASPVGVVFDESLRLYVSDSAGKVFAFGPDGGLLFTLQTAGTERLQRPTGIAYSPRKKLLYVVDTLANKVHAFATNGDFAFSFGERGDAKGHFNFPTHIFSSPAGDLYVTDALNFRVQIFDEQGGLLGAFGHHGDGSGDMAMPKGVAVDGDGIVYVVDGIFDNLQLFNRRGEFLLTVGRRGTDYGEFWLPSGAFFSEQDKLLYVCDTYNRRVQVFRITEGYEHGGS
jgi:DNA-binding beta-propeller fold protein YncE